MLRKWCNADATRNKIRPRSTRKCSHAMKRNASHYRFRQLLPEEIELTRNSISRTLDDAVSPSTTTTRIEPPLKITLHCGALVLSLERGTLPLRRCSFISFSTVGPGLQRNADVLFTSRHHGPGSVVTHHLRLRIDHNIEHSPNGEGAIAAFERRRPVAGEDRLHAIVRPESLHRRKVS